MNNTVQTSDVDVGESTSKLVNWSLANRHVGETTVIRAVNYKIKFLIIWLETIWKIFFRGFTISFKTKQPKTIIQTIYPGSKYLRYFLL